MIGMSCTSLSSRDLKEAWDSVSKDFSHWEIFSEARHSVISVSNRFNELRDGYSMTYSVHAPIADVNIGAVSENLREAATIEMSRTFLHANRMNINLITVHPGLRSMSVSGVDDISIAQAKKSLKEIDRYAREYGITAAIENMPSFPFMLGQHPEELLELIDGTDLSICFDIGHANTVGVIDSCIDLFGDRIANVHIHDNMGDRDAHLTIGEGNIDFEHVLRRMGGYNGNFIIESRDIPSAVESQKRLKKLFSDLR